MCIRDSRKVLPKGTHQIGREKIVTKKDLWDCVPKEEKIKFKMEDGKVFVDLERQYLPGYAAPSVTYQQKQIVSEAKSGLGAIGKGILAVLLAGGAAPVSYTHLMVRELCRSVWKRFARGKLSLRRKVRGSVCEMSESGSSLHMEKNMESKLSRSRTKALVLH